MALVIVADLSILGTLGKIGGVAGIGLGLVAITFRDVIRKRIFPKLSDDQAFSLLRLIVVLSWSLALASLGTWAYALWIEHNYDHAQEAVLSGIVRGEDGKEISDALVVAFVGDRPQAQDRTTSTGLFRLTMNNVASTIRIAVNKEGYAHWEDRVSIPQSELRITLKSDRVARSAMKPSDKPGSFPTRLVAQQPPPPAPSGSSTSLVTEPNSLRWEQINADLKKNYSGMNVVHIAQFGIPTCETKSDGRYCRQAAHVTLQSADETQRCYAVIAKYKLEAKQWHLDEVNQDGIGCSN